MPTTRPTHYTVYSGNSVKTFRGDLSVLSSRVKKSSWPLKIGPIGCPETSVRNYHCRPRNIAEQTRCHLLFYVHGPVHCELIPIIVQQDATIYSLLYFCKLLHMFRVVPPPIIRSTFNCNYRIWHWSNRLCYLPLSWRGCSKFFTTVEVSRDGLNSARRCNYS